MLNRVRYFAETSLGVASFEDMDLGEGHAESPLLIVTLSRSTCAISRFSCLLGRPSKSVGFTRRTNMACMNMYLHIILMARCRRRGYRLVATSRCTHVACQAPPQEQSRPVHP